MRLKRWFRGLVQTTVNRLQDYLDTTEYEEWGKEYVPHCTGPDKCLLCLTLASYMPHITRSVLEGGPVLWKLEKNTEGEGKVVVPILYSEPSDEALA